MALLTCDFRSDVLDLQTSMTVILPKGRAPAAGFPTLWLLHGMSDDHTAWTRQTAVERYVAETGWAVVMPQVDRSYYADMAHGNRYWTFVSEELPRIAREMFRLSDCRADNAAAGLSMGGYGAFKLALNFPNRYRAAASLSGALDPVGMLKEDPSRKRDWDAMFGSPPRIVGTVSDLFAKATAVAAGPHADLRLYQCCGEEDFLLENQRGFRDHALKQGLDLTYEEHAGFGHTWDYWDQQIQRVLGWLAT